MNLPTSPATTVLMLHDYPPVRGGGLARAAQDLAASLGQVECAILSGRLVDHFADDRQSSQPVQRASLRAALRRLRRADVVIVHWTFSFRRLSTFAVLTAPLMRTRILCVVHTAPDHCRYNRVSRLPGFVRGALMRAIRRGLSNCGGTVALSRSHAVALQRVGITATHVLPLPVQELEAYGGAYCRHQATDQPLDRIGIAGELSALKGTDTVPALLERLTPDLQFRIVGDGPLRPTLERRIRALPRRQRDAVSFCGRLDPWDMGDFYGAVDFLLVTSRTESQCRVALEAMLAGVIVLARPVGGLLDLVHDRVTGCFVDPEDSGAVAQTVRFLRADSAAASRIRAQARGFATELNQQSGRAWRELLGGAGSGLMTPSPGQQGQHEIL